MMKKIFCILILGLFILSPTYAGKPKGDDKNKNQIKKVLTDNLYSTMAINNLEMWFSNTGVGSYNKVVAGAGCYFPKGSTQTCIFEDGPILGGLVNGNQRLVGSTYNTCFSAGGINANGSQQDRTLTKYRIYQINKDWEKMDEGTVKEQYKKDYQEWPIEDGAPWEYDGQGKKVPKFIGDEQAWWVMNDMNSGLASGFYGTDYIGTEWQCLIWGYNMTGALGNTIFRKFTIINKGNNDVDSTYLAWFSDVDDGDGTDDYSGCDTSLSVGYVYNGNATDNSYGANPPAVGYDYFQGPTVKSENPDDIANWNFGKKQGYKNLPLTSYTFFDRTAPVADYQDPTLGSVTGGVQMYNLMKGLKKNGDPWTNPQTGRVTKFNFPGDPVTKSGWIDGPNNVPAFTPGDKRLLLSAGPFKLAKKDTQELVVGTIVGQGSDRLSSITVMKFYDLSAQIAYDNNFVVSKPPAQPKVTVSEMENKIVLYWGDPDQIIATENTVTKGYAFEGYNVYQLPAASSTKANAKKIATYDVINDITTVLDQELDEASGVIVKKPVQTGKNTGLAHYMIIDQDYIKSAKLVNGQSYFFTVTAYSVNEDPNMIPYCLEDPFDTKTVVPQSIKPGYALTSTIGTTVKADIPAGIKSDAMCQVSVIDPTKVTGNTYEVAFDTAGHYDAENDEWVTSFYWKMVNKTTGKTAITKNTNLSGDNVYPTIDGLFIKVSAPLRPDGSAGNGLRDDADPDGKTGFDWITAGTRPWGGDVRFINPQSYTNWAFDCYGPGRGAGEYNSIGWPGPSSLFATTSVTPDKLKKVEIRFSADATKQQKAYRYLRRATYAAADPSFSPYIINPVAGYPFQDYVTVPFTVWDVDASPAKQLACGFMENNEAKSTGLGNIDGKWKPTTAASGGREFLFIFASNYTASPDAKYTTEAGAPLDLLTYPRDMMYWAAFVNRVDANGNEVRTWPYSSTFKDQTLQLIPYYPVSKDVKFTFTAPAAVNYDQTNAKSEVERITVFPNPYYGFNSKEQNVYNRYITFNHLPVSQKVSIKIYTLAGQLVRTLTEAGKSSPSSQFINWDLKNENHLQVASGMYIAYIDMPDLGAKRIIKFAIIMEAQLLDRI